MDQDLLNIVNENGEVIGIATREEVHTRGSLHREVHVWFIDRNNKIVFQHRSKTKSNSPDLLDATVGGHVEIGMDYSSTAIKEIHEETGLEIEESQLQLVKIVKSNTENPVTNKKNNVSRAVFCFRFMSDIQGLKMEKGEGVGFESFSLEELEVMNELDKKRFIPNIIERNLSIFKEILS